MTRNIICLAALLVTAGLQGASAQEKKPAPIWAGPRLAFGLGLESATVLIYDGSSADCGSFTNGTGLGGSAGGVLLLPELFGERLGGEARLLFATSTSRFTALPQDPQRVFDPATLQLVE